MSDRVEVSDRVVLSCLWALLLVHCTLPSDDFHVPKGAGGDAAMQLEVSLRIVDQAELSELRLRAPIYEQLEPWIEASLERLGDAPSLGAGLAAAEGVGGAQQANAVAAPLLAVPVVGVALFAVATVVSACAVADCVAPLRDLLTDESDRGSVSFEHGPHRLRASVDDAPMPSLPPGPGWMRELVEPEYAMLSAYRSGQLTGEQRLSVTATNALLFERLGDFLRQKSDALSRATSATSYRCSGKPPLLLVPGNGERESSMPRELVESLTNTLYAGEPDCVYVAEYLSPLERLRAHDNNHSVRRAAIIAATIATMRVDHSTERIDIVGHSMGVTMTIHALELTHRLAQQDDSIPSFWSNVRRFVSVGAGLRGIAACEHPVLLNYASCFGEVDTFTFGFRPHSDRTANPRISGQIGYDRSAYRRLPSWPRAQNVEFYAIGAGRFDQLYCSNLNLGAGYAEESCRDASFFEMPRARAAQIMVGSGTPAHRYWGSDSSSGEGDLLSSLVALGVEWTTGAADLAVSAMSSFTGLMNMQGADRDGVGHFGMFRHTTQLHLNALEGICRYPADPLLCCQGPDLPHSCAVP